MVMLPVVHMSRGVKKAYHKSQLQGSYPGTDKSAASKPVVVVEAEGDDVMAASSMHGAYGNTTSIRSASLCKILRAAKELLLVCIACDFGLYVLCACTSMCESPVSSTSLLGARGLTEYMRHGIVSLSFILLLGGVMDIFYCWAMLLLTMAAAVVPSIRDMPQQYPKRAFIKPLSATSVRDFWSFRWHQFFRFYFEGLGRAAVDGLLGPIHVPFVIRATLYTVVAFGMSGVLHEYLSWASTGRATGLFMVFSAVQFVAVVVEAVCGRVCKAAIAPLLRRGLGGTAAAETAMHTAGHCWVLAVGLLSAPLFVEPLRMLGFHVRCTMFSFGVHVTPLVLSWVVGWLSNSYAAPMTARPSGSVVPAYGGCMDGTVLAIVLLELLRVWQWPLHSMATVCTAGQLCRQYCC